MQLRLSKILFIACILFLLLLFIKDKFKILKNDSIYQDQNSYLSQILDNLRNEINEGEEMYDTSDIEKLINEPKNLDRPTQSDDFNSGEDAADIFGGKFHY